VLIEKSGTMHLTLISNCSVFTSELVMLKLV